MADKVRAIVGAGIFLWFFSNYLGIPVMGHIGLTPQTLSALGGFRVQGNTAEKAALIVEDAKALEEAGSFKNSSLSLLTTSF